ncbi:malonate decarboxylase acyl carrier protein [Acuticoccus sediminis]|uniref:malonate decarboxylase acyl carrier protein n=1 Tax=Acuticoccus sediminis TaxID=2184697 RepID=UPI001CFC7BFA|nr:malonate decarboxylase acyl carrier protein [Acuticoccus sediminis]
MQTLTFHFDTAAASRGTTQSALVGVVASGNLEVLAERVLAASTCEVTVATPVTGFDAVWQEVVSDVVARTSPGGLRLSINDGGARPDTVTLRLMQVIQTMEMRDA